MPSYDAFGGPEPQDERRGRTATRGPQPGSAPAQVLGRLLLMVVVVAAVVAMRALDTPDRRVGIPAAAVSATSAPSIMGLGEDSYFRRENFARALRAVQRERVGTPLSIVVRPDLVELRLRAGRHRLVRAVVGPLGVVELDTGGRAPDPLPRFPWRLVDPATPQRLIREGVAQSGASATDAMFVAWLPQATPVWSMTLRSGVSFAADHRGRIAPAP